MAAYAALPDYAQRVYARVLPVEASVAACRETGLPAAHIYAVQGPFPEELNVAMLHACNAQILVTKQTGSKGGFFEKVSAAQKAGVTLLVIGRPESAPGVSFGEAMRLLQQRFDFRMPPQVTVVGIGPGDRDHETVAPHRGQGFVDFQWLDSQPAVYETRYIRHLRLNAPLTLLMDGRHSCGAILRPARSVQEQ